MFFRFDVQLPVTFLLIKILQWRMRIGIIILILCNNWINFVQCQRFSLNKLNELNYWETLMYIKFIMYILMYIIICIMYINICIFELIVTYINKLLPSRN